MVSGGAFAGRVDEAQPCLAPVLAKLAVEPSCGFRVNGG
jgi:hypothetical protein